MITHPSFTQLNDYADRELPEKARARVSGHLAKCCECRNTVMSIRNMTDEASRLSEITAPAGALGRILERYAAGERVILPVADPPARRVSAWGPRRAAVAAAVAIAAMASIFSVKEIGAERSEMELHLVNSVRGQTIEVDFRSTSRFVDEQFLTVRARYREAGDQGRSSDGRVVVVGGLLRNDDRSFRGIIQLPASAVYAVFAVEDASGENVDHNSGSLWEYLAIGSDGNPTHEALIQKQFDLTGRDWEQAFTTAQQATDLYPDSAEAWGRLIAFGGLGLDGTSRDSLRAHYTDSFERLDRLYSNATLSTDQLAWMYDFAFRVESRRVDFWRKRLADEAPGHLFAVQQRVFDIDERYGHAPAEALRQLNDLWNEAGPMRPIVDLGRTYALELGDVPAILQWTERLELVPPTAALALAERLVEIPELRRQGIDRLREQLQRMDAESETTRALYRSGADHRIRREADRREFMTALGRALVEAGDIDAGLDTLRLAVEHGWDVKAFSAMADAYFSLGETSGATAMLANVFVDPSTPDTTASDVARRAQALTDGSSWEQLVAYARLEMHRRTLAEAAPRPLAPEEAEVVDADGRSHRLRALVKGHVTLVVLATRYCRSCLNELPNLDAVLKRIGAYDDVNAMIITGEQPTGEMQQLVTDMGMDIPVYYDMERAAHQALNAWETPGYFVLDRSGLVRFSANSFEEVVRQVEALRTAEGA
ncbi:MAG: redoxin domain-containing protein [Gemmatimonadetes bacterium]|nr:redoxin domain-containing protein [Gemmatimonadota bacterium]